MRVTPWRVAFGLVVLLSLVVLFAPGSDVPTGVPVSDKLVHGGLFAALALTGVPAGVPPVGLATALAAYAGISEVLQGVLPISRDADWRDALADIVGVVVGLVLAVRLRPRGRAS